MSGAKRDAVQLYPFVDIKFDADIRVSFKVARGDLENVKHRVEPAVAKVIEHVYHVFAELYTACASAASLRATEFVAQACEHVPSMLDYWSVRFHQ